MRRRAVSGVQNGTKESTVFSDGMTMTRGTDNDAKREKCRRQRILEERATKIGKARKRYFACKRYLEQSRRLILEVRAMKIRDARKRYFE